MELELKPEEHQGTEPLKPGGAQPEAAQEPELARWPEVEPGLEAESQGLGLELEWPQQELECESKLRAVG